MSEVTENTIFVGPCKCGGYGIVYNAEAEAELGRCHDDLKELRIRDLETQRNVMVSVCDELLALIDLAQEDVTAHEYETIRTETLDRARKLIAQVKAKK